jgi:RNA polymerase sigma-70 factor (ECF subfamily)
MKPPESVAPADLAGRIAEGDPDAERAMVERYSRGVRFLLLELTRDPARADDLHQETFRLVLEKVRGGELREPEKLPAFIRQIARNLFIAEYRKKAKHPKVGGDEAVAISPDPAPGPQQRLLDRENAAIVRRLLAELEPPRDREILLRSPRRRRRASRSTTSTARSVSTDSSSPGGCAKGCGRWPPRRGRW